jgi:hypothetical protein
MQGRWNNRQETVEVHAQLRFRVHPGRILDNAIKTGIDNVLIDILPTRTTRSAVGDIAHCLGYGRLVKCLEPSPRTVDLGFGAVHTHCVGKCSST